MARKKITITLDEKTLEQMDTIAKSYSLSRSAVIGLSVAKYVQQEQLLDILPEMMKMAREQQAKDLLE